ncbi:hypothetical protein RND81_11G062400 [Saponaria officinalis]|uniref:non-specific serine/threonine protein kinase n=1 Tax=Saponaria officinalis TaxID=3572 RepID=A0AAW1HK98_SAPOF
MKKLICFPHMYSFTLTLFIKTSLFSAFPENHFGDCISTKCGDINISYPFHISSQQKPYCGYPGLDVNCTINNLPYLNISGLNYVIKNISYEEQIIQVVNPVFSESSGNKSQCLGSLPSLNITLNNGLYEFVTDQKQIFLFKNCPQSILRQMSGNLVICGAVAAYEDDAEVGVLRANCNGMVSVPYEGDNKNVSDVKAMLEEGFSLKWIASSRNCNGCRESGGQCGYDQSNDEFICFCSDQTHAYTCFPSPTAPTVMTNSRRSKSIIIASVSGSLALVILVVVALIIITKKGLLADKFPTLDIKSLKENQNVEAFLKSYGSLAPKRYRYTDIKKITKSFKEKLGEGGFGSVYKGKLEDGRFVAVKLLNKMKGNGEDFVNEVLSISRTNHVNVVTLLGFCLEGNRRALIYEYLVNGSLDKFIYDAQTRSSLKWETLFKIAVGIARGLDYLHRGCNTRILHFDIKPQNVLLDEEFCPKISDFGLAKLCSTKDSTISMLEARGTIGYIAPEVFYRNFGGVSHKSDVYSYGMMVLNMACERASASTELQRSSELYFTKWILNRLEQREEYASQPTLSEEEKEIQRKMILVSLWCIQTYPSSRPSMNKVLEMIEGPIESLSVPPRATTVYI